jgi:heptosyltransferase-3
MGFHNLHNLAVIRGGAIGDFVLTLPAIQALRYRFPQARFSLIGNPHILTLVQADVIFDHNSAQFAPLYTPIGALPPATRSIFEEIDLLLAYAVDPDRVLESRLNSLVKGQVIVYDPRPAPQSESHIIDHLLVPLHHCGIPVPNSTPQIHELAIDRAYALHCRQSNPTFLPLVVVHPGSGGRHKCWPLNHFIKLIKYLAEHALQVALLLGPVEEALHQELKDSLPFSCPVLRPPGLAELAGLLESADLFIGNDSGPTHLSAALGTSTLALFGPTNPKIWGPRGSFVRILQAPAGNLKALEVDSVRRAVFEQLGRR